MAENSTPFTDLSEFTALPRVTGLALSTDGRRLVAVLSSPDPKGARYRGALWEIDPDGAAEPRRLTFSEKGESAPVFTPDGTLLFISARPAPENARTDSAGGADSADSALWALPPSGEATLHATLPGGIDAVRVAAGTGRVFLAGRRLLGSSETAEDAERRRDRSDRKIGAILHTGMPIRYWDHELGSESPRIFELDTAGAPADLTADAVFELVEAGWSLSADGGLVATSWTERRPHGRSATGIRLIDTAGGERRRLDVAGGETFQPLLSPDGSRLAVTVESEASFDTPLRTDLQVHELATGAVTALEVGDVWPTEYAWSPDSRSLYVTGDWHGRGAVLAIDAQSGTGTHRLTCDAVYSNLAVAPDGAVYALRSGIDEPAAPVRLDPRQADQIPVRLPSPGAAPALPGTVTEVSTVVAGTTVRGWLCLPHGAAQLPAPVQLCVHGGPFSSWNGWKWRWNPWVAVARGWAVLMPDPALSTGYGQGFIERAWPHRAEQVWRDCEALLDEVLDRPDIDASGTVCLGASFGGYMTNWIAGHTDRFAAIVTHAGLWALDQQHATTDAAEWKTLIFDSPAEHPEWYAENSPHNFVQKIVTPMLITHGNRDYRVPFSEALRLWWDLVRNYDDDPAGLPHRFLELTGENHWILSPANSAIWYETVQGFLDQHARGGPPLDPGRVLGTASNG